MQCATHVQHRRIVHIHSLLCVGSAILIIEVHAGVVDEHVDAAVLCDFFRKVSDTTAIRDIELGVDYATRGVI